MNILEYDLRITLAAARVNVGLTQKEVAKKLGISNKTLQSWEKGTSDPSVSQAETLCSLYRRPMDSIIFLQTNPT